MPVFDSQWKQSLREASFRGVPFFIDTHNFGTGLRTVTHEFPEREEPFTEDIGRKARNFSIQGHILGDDYFRIRDQIIEACEKRGAGELIHPYLGSRIVKCSDLQITEDTKDGRIATLSFTFVEAGSVSFPRAVDDKQEILNDLAAQADNQAIQEFEEKFSVSGFPGQVTQSARDQVQEATENFKDSTETIATASDDIAEFAFGLRNLQAEIDALLNEPSKLASRLQGSIDLLVGSGFTAKDAFKSAQFLFSFGSSTTFNKVDIDTPSRNQQNQNTDAVKNLVRRLAVTAAVKQGILADFLSVSEAVEERQTVISVIDEQAQETDSDDLFQSLRDIGVTFTDAVPDVDQDLPNIVEFQVKTTKPAIVIAYDLGEDADLEQDIIDRNNIRHPGFVEGGQEIEVLSNV